MKIITLESLVCNIRILSEDAALRQLGPYTCTLCSDRPTLLLFIRKLNFFILFFKIFDNILN